MGFNSALKTLSLELYVFIELTDTVNVVPFSLTTFYLRHDKWSTKHNSALTNNRY